MNKQSPEAIEIAENYYDSTDADNFYHAIWGGEDIHIGLYEPGDTIAEASHKTVLAMAERLYGLDHTSKVLDIGSGYGGAARVLARKYSALVTCLNLSKVENDRNAQMNADQNLAHKITVEHGSFDAIPADPGSFDIVWSQDAILHAPDRLKVLDEVARVLKPGGQFIFTDPMQADGLTDTDALTPILERIHLPNLGSIEFYRKALAERGFDEVRVDVLTHQLRAHYARVGEELAAQRSALSDKISDEYAERMLKGLQHWVDGADKGLLAWGILHFKKAG